MLKSKQAYDITKQLFSMYFDEHFVIEGESSIILGVKLRQTIFIAMRGTQSASDLLADAFLIPAKYFRDDYRFHCGFFICNAKGKS